MLTPALTIVKTASTTAAVPGAVIGYTITVTNTGQTPYAGAAVTDSFAKMSDDAAYNGDAAATAGSLSYAAPVLTWTGDLAAGAAAVITYTVTVHNPDTGGKLVINSVSSAAAGSACPPGSVSTACRLSIPVLTPALTITTTASTPTATPGQQVTYTITVTDTDTGQTPYTGAAFTDPLGGVLPDAAYNNDAAAAAGSVTYTSPTLTWTGNLAPGGAATITYTVTVNNPDTGGHILTSTVTSAAPGSNCAAGSADPRCTTVTIVTVLTIVNTASVSTITPGSAVAFTITITNTGQAAYTGATVTDPLDGIVDDAAYNGDAAATSGSLSYASPDLTWTGDLAPGQAATITYTVTVSNPDTGDKHLVNTATSDNPGSTCPTRITSPACTATVTDLIPALTITKTANVSTVTPGSAVGYTITVTDTGQTPYSAVQVTDSIAGDLRDAAYNHDATATTGTLSYTSPVLTWTGDLAPGNTATITYSVTVNNPGTGGGALSNTAVSAAPGSTCPSGSSSPACSVTVPIISGPLSITTPASASLGSAAPGGTLSAALGTVQVTDNRGFGAGWTATVSATAFTTGNGTPAETIPPGDVSYDITGLGQTTGSASFTPVPVTNLTVTSQTVVSATNVNGNTSVAWDPLIDVHVPDAAIAGQYTATITHSVS